MKKLILLCATIATTALSASADNEILNITLNNGTTTQINVAEIKELTFTDAEKSLTAGYTGDFVGKMQLSVAGAYNYETDMTLNIVAGADGESITVNIPEYSMAGTMMGDITLSPLTIDGLMWDETAGGFYRSYGGQGLTQHFKASKNGRRWPGGCILTPRTGASGTTSTLPRCRH